MMPSDDHDTATRTEEPEFVQLLNPDGQRVTSPGYDQWVADLTDADLSELLADMVIARRIDTEATALQRQGELGLWPPLFGQEAAQIGSARALARNDFVFSSYRENGVAYCRGVGMEDMVRVWRGNANSGWNPFDVNMATPQVIIGAQTLHAVGYAMGAANDDADDVAITYFGDGATSEGDVSEALVFAASFHAPVVFFCQNNGWAISEPVSLQSTQHLSKRAAGFGVPSMRVDGNDVLAVLAATRIALDRARSGNGPTFIEAVTYRMGPHTTADDPKRYRGDNDLEEWAARDPISRVEAFLRERGQYSDEDERALTKRADAVGAELRAACTGMADPEPMSVFDHVYAEPNTHVDRQREAYRRYLSMFDPDAASANHDSAGAARDGGTR